MASALEISVERKKFDAATIRGPNRDVILFGASLARDELGRPFVTRRPRGKDRREN
jgi:hypothetical protein